MDNEDQDIPIQEKCTPLQSKKKEAALNDQVLYQE